MKLNKASRGYDLLIVGFFFTAIVLFLAKTILLGLLFALIGWYLVWKNEQALELIQFDSTNAEYAGFWKRFGSSIVDWFFWSFVFAGLFLTAGNKMFDFLNYGLFNLFCLLLALYLLKRWGQTFGKMALGLKVVKIDLSEITWREILLRESLDIISVIWGLIQAALVLSRITDVNMVLISTANPDSFPSNALTVISDKLPTLFLLWLFSELLILLTNRKKRALHDYLAGTVVISLKTKPRYSAPLVWTALIFVSLHTWYFSFHRAIYTEYYANRGVTRSQRYLGLRYFSGTFSDKNYDLAHQWFQLAADQGDAESFWYLGQIEELGLGVSEDQIQAEKYYRSALDRGFAGAQKSLKELNNPHHQFMVGFRYYKSIFNPKDYNKAFQWFRKAALNGDPSAQGYLGELYEKGLGVSVDQIQAIHWYTIGAQNGNYHSKNALRRLGVNKP